MKMLKNQMGTAIIELQADELVILSNALNEVCNGLEIPELSTRMGAELSEISALQEQITSVLDGMQAVHNG
jgi:hypothetical protein